MWDSESGSLEAVLPGYSEAAKNLSKVPRFYKAFGIRWIAKAFSPLLERSSKKQRNKKIKTFFHFSLGAFDFE